MAPPLTLTLSSSSPELVGRGQADSGEGLVDLEEIDVADAMPACFAAWAMAREGWVSSEVSGPATWP